MDILWYIFKKIVFGEKKLWFQKLWSENLVVGGQASWWTKRGGYPPLFNNWLVHLPFAKPCVALQYIAEEWRGQPEAREGAGGEGMQRVYGGAERWCVFDLKKHKKV